jgi:hypothetical protein
MKRRPPKHNVRRVRAIQGNMRYTLVNKCQRSILCESFQEYKLALLLERNPSVTDYLSQPEQLLFHNAMGRQASYIPDFQVWHSDSKIELHEVTIQERRSKTTQAQREQAAHRICQARGWTYCVHTESSLPSGSELANLQLLFGFRAYETANPQVEAVLAEILLPPQPCALKAVVAQVASVTGLTSGQVLPALFHLLWQGRLQTDWQQLLCQNAAPHPAAVIWQEG